MRSIKELQGVTRKGVAAGVSRKVCWGGAREGLTDEGDPNPNILDYPQRL